ncbi:flavin-containing monooxygenase [Aquihabitans sp. McL0605]|uniref:flavin-containing monooxygenase n=1 Tax=Aquihabitans sp. McL0605 TaxID=3415671 RepID=UPI003CF80429
MSDRYAGLPITDDDATIAAALEDVSVPTLLVSLVHLTGDASILDGPHRPVGNYLNEVQGFMSPEDQASARAFALDKIIEFRDGGCVLPPPPSAELVHRMMEFLVAGEVPAEYVPLMLEELALDGTDVRDQAWVRDLDPTVQAAFHVVVIGAGMSGLLAGIKLAAAEIPFTIVEKNAGVGGTWFENRYPGCRVDVGNHFYSYSFAPDDEWSEYFARQPELQAYFDRCMRDYGITDHIRFETEVRSAVWDEESATWTVDTTGGPLVANAVISAVGQLNRPKLPDIEGLDSFEGEAMHSAQWVEGTDLAGKRMAVVGTGASAFQLVPTVAPEVDHLTVFQRSAQWMFPNPNYHAQVGAGVPWAIRHLPYYGRWYRFLLFWPACDGGLIAMTIDPDYADPEHGISDINDAARDMFTQWMADQIGDDPELLAKVVPDYVCLGKRTLQDNGSWLGALTRPDVELVTEAIERITPTGVRTADGVDHDVDVIVYATGFHANKYLWPMDIVGRDGVVLGEQWGDRPTALYGITVPNFPNLFCLYGPGTNLASGGSLIFHSECQVRYVMGCIEALLGGEERAIEVRQEAHDEYNVRLQARMKEMVWSHPSIKTSWYRNDEGDIYILSPWRLVDYWAWTKAPDLQDFELT